MSLYEIVYFSLVTYLIASIPFGVIFAKYFHLGDLREVGSGNIGATNVLRTGNKQIAALTLLADALKGFVPLYFFTTNQFSEYTVIIFLCALLGHIYPVFLNFKGGKGVATFAGGLLGCHLWLGLSFIAIWVSVFYFFKRSSLSALVAIWGVNALSFLFLAWPMAACFSLFSLLISYTHLENIKRLMAGSEPKFNLNLEAEAEKE